MIVLIGEATSRRRERVVAVSATARRVGERGRETAAAPLGVAGERAAVARRGLFEQAVPPREHSVVELLA